MLNVKIQSVLSNALVIPDTLEMGLFVKVGHINILRVFRLSTSREHVLFQITIVTLMLHAEIPATRLTAFVILAFLQSIIPRALRFQGLRVLKGLTLISQLYQLLLLVTATFARSK